MAGSREKILGSLPSGRAPRPETTPLTTFAEEDLWSAFEVNLAALGGRLISAEDLIHCLEQNCFIEDAAMGILERLQISTGPSDPDGDLWDVAVGVSVGDLAIAETGSIVVSAGPSKQRMSTLVPPANIVLMKRDAIVARLSDAIPLLSSRSSAIITGPSRTADIEGILVKGVHGPGDLMVFVYE